MNKNYSISYTWSQPYVGWTVQQPANINAEMRVVEAIDNIVDAMKFYPDAEAVMAKILGSK